MKLHTILAAAVCVAPAACSERPAPDVEDSTANKAVHQPATGQNALLEEWDTPFGAPPFDRIRSEDYLPAIRAGMDAQNAEIDGIVNNPDAATFANTIEALERTGSALGRVTRVFYAVNSAHSNDVIKETAKIIAPELAAHGDNIWLNEALFDRVAVVYGQRDELGLGAEQSRLLEELHKEFVRAGANLEDDAKDRLREINADLASLSQEFENNLLDDTNAFELLVTDPADLGNLPASLVAGAADEAGRRGHDCECWVFTLQRPSINPFLQYSPNRELREQIFDGYAMRGDNDNEHDNKNIVTRIVQLRAERAALLGYESHAHYVLSDSMAETPDNVYDLLQQVWEPSLDAATIDRGDLQAMMQTDGIEDRLRGWDWRYYTEKVRKARYDIDEDALRPYFEVNSVRDGAFSLANRLFGLSFEQRHDIPRWHPDQQVFEVRDADDSHLAILYLDYFARDSKRGGAWMNALRPQSNLDRYVTPIVTNNFNFPAPAAGSPSLLSLTEAQTFFHEIGHALHGMLSNVTYESLAGTSVARDFVEFPSQLMENWMNTPEFLNMFAKHYKTGQPIPAEIVDKIVAAGKFDQGFAMVEYLAAAFLDLAYHDRTSTEAIEPRAFEARVMREIGLIEEIIPRYRSGYFAHIFAGGYSAGYYSYIWAEMLDADTFMAFREKDLFDQGIAAAYREHVLSKGGSEPGMDLYRNFLGRDPEIGALLKKRGLD
jgi:peptidyl-dipeptidase Dcp